jgi:Protein of unknown function (DUF4038)/Domain of unknown function (DUF5060)/Concanavalin A-like lectin/glucanases superfamily/Putative collagen-binding domain of a collagenase
MKRIRSQSCLTVLLILLVSTSIATALPELRFVDHSGDVGVSDFAEITLHVTNPNVANPFVDASVQGTFQLEEEEPIPVAGFCDAPDGTLFRIRFMPRRPGRYRYKILYRQSGVEVEHRGTFQAVASGRRGLLRVDPGNRWHFVWEGTREHYFWNGTTTYYLMGWDEETIHDSIDRLNRLKINRLRVLLYGRNNPRPWRQPVVPTDDFKLHLNPWPAQRPDNIKNPGFDLTRFNLDHWRKYERLLRYAREKDMIVSVIFFIGGQVLPTPFEAGSKAEDLYYRYGIARLAAFSNITWDLGNEHNFHRKVPDWADTLGPRVKEWDPYDHLTSAHNVAYRTPKSTWLDMQLIQRWDSGQNAYMLGQRHAQQERDYIIPQINEEYGYEDLWEKYPGQRAAETRRKNAWEIYMAGCYQTNGESSRRGTGTAPDTGGGWVNGRGDDAMTMLAGCGHIVDFFTAFDWWNCEPLNAAIMEGSACCLGKPGNLYVLYFRAGGRATVRLSEDRYRGKWYNPRTGQWQGIGQVSGPVWATPPTPDANDWVLWLKKDNASKDTRAPEVISIATGRNGRRVLVDFDELPKETSVTNPACYAIRPETRIQKISLGGRYGTTAILSVSPLKEGRVYMLTVNGVQDRAGNRMEPTELPFEFIPADQALVALTFNEGEGQTTKNTGTSRRTVKHAKLTPERPLWSRNTPPNGGPRSLDFGNEAGKYAVDLPEEAIGAREGLASFTLTAWVNCTSDAEGAGGNRIVHMADTLGTKAGVDLVFVRDGRLKLGINEWPDTTKAVSSAGLIPVDKKASKTNWRFIAITYNANAERDHVKFYVGSADDAASLDKAISYDRGPLQTGTGTLTVGHFNPGVRAEHSDRIFRGLIDEVRIFGSKTDGTAALSLEQIRAIQTGHK